VAIPTSLLDEMRGINLLLQSGRLDEARTRLEAVVEAHPGFVEALRLLAGTKLALGEAQAAEALLRRALEIDPHWTPTLTTLGELLLSGGRGAEAESALQRAASGSRPDPLAARVLARYYNDSGRPAEALCTASPFLARDCTDSELASQHARALIALGRHAQAITAYGSLLAAAPDNPAPAQALAMVLNAAGRHGEARRITQRVLARGFKTATLFHTHARSLMAEGDARGAETALRECLRLEPQRIEAHNSLAQLVWVRTGDLAQATELLEQALLRSPNDDALWAAKAAILQGAGDARGAYECLAPRAGRAHAPPVLLLRAGLAALESDPQTALSLAERALRAMPANASARTLRAAARLGIGEARGALEDCEALLGAEPDDQYLIALESTALRLLGDARHAQLCDYRSLVLPLTLEPPAPWQSLAGFLSDIKASLERLHDPEGHALLFKSLRGGTETTRDLTRNTDPAIRALFSAFAQPIARYLEHIGRGTDPLRRRNSGRWRFNGSWSVRLRDRGYHTTHTHPKGWISSACYIELPDHMADARTEEGILTFGEPGIITRPALEAEYSVRPAAGMLVLFPSYFWHGTVPFRGPQARMTVAFDVVPE
jgi:predicted Zn-dependent protease